MTTTQEEFAAKLEKKDQSHQNYQLALGHEGSDVNVIDLIIETPLAYIDAAHDAMQAGLELIARRAK